MLVMVVVPMVAELAVLLILRAQARQAAVQPGRHGQITVRLAGDHRLDAPLFQFAHQPRAHAGRNERLAGAQRVVAGSMQFVKGLGPGQAQLLASHHLPILQFIQEEAATAAGVSSHFLSLVRCHGDLHDSSKH